MLKRISIVISILVILSMALTTALAAEDVQTAADAYFSGGTQNIKAADLFDLLNDGDESNDPFIIDVRTPEDYALGHVPGAVNMGAKVAFTADKLATIPQDKEVVVYCYTGQTSSQMVSALNMLGYKAKSMLFGFPAWANVEGITGPAAFNREVDGNDYMVSDEAANAGGSYAMPTALGSTVAGAAEAYFANGTKNISASAVFDNLNDGDVSNDPYIIDVRSAEDYAAGHIPGAVNMSAKAIFSADNLATIPSDKQVVVVCYTGQTASQVTSALNMLGYNATNLKFGFATWSPTVNYPFNAVSDSGNYRFEGTSVAAAPAPAGDEAPATLPVSGGVPFDFIWVYLLASGGLLGSGLYLLRRK